MSVYDDVFAALDARRVRYVVVGGVAVVLHGHARMTVDLDLVIDLAAEPAAAAIDALTGLGLRPRIPVDPRSFADEATRRTWVQERNLVVFSLHDPDDPRREVDVFADYPLPFDELLAASVVREVGGCPVRVAGIPHLIALKRVAGRPRDEEDIAALTALLDEQREQS